MLTYLLQQPDQRVDHPDSTSTQTELELQAHQQLSCWSCMHLWSLQCIDLPGSTAARYCAGPGALCSSDGLDPTSNSDCSTHARSQILLRDTRDIVDRRIENDIIRPIDRWLEGIAVVKVRSSSVKPDNLWFGHQT